MAKRYLIVDDDPAVRQMIQDLLAAPDVEFCDARDGAEAAEAYRLNRPDLVAMDIEMQPVDGLSATRLIRKQDSTAQIVVVSQYDSRQLREAARAAGASAYLAKENLSELERFVSQVTRPRTAG